MAKKSYPQSCNPKTTSFSNGWSGHAENYLTADDASLNSTQQDSTKREQQTWALLCQTLMMRIEFIYLR